MESVPILEAQGLRKIFGAVTAAWDISAAIQKDTVVGLIGANGAGKTTFINMITGYLKPSAGTIHFQGRDITPFPPREITRMGVCRSFQIPQLYDSLSVEDNILVGLGIVSRVNKKSFFSRTRQKIPPSRQAIAPEAAGAIMDRFGLSDYRDKPANVLPGGIRKLLDIAMSMVGKPQIMMLDEPTSGINADQKFDIMDMIMEALRAEGVTVLFVEHDMEIVSRYSDRILAFYEGRVIADGRPEEVLTDGKVRQYVIGENKQTVKKGAPEMLKIKELNVSIQSVRILRGVDLDLPTGTVAGLIGRNGAGKTTLMRSIMGLLPASSGQVEFDDINLREVPPYGRSSLGIGYMPEERRLIPELTVEENILLPAWAIGAKEGPERLQKIYQMIPEMKTFTQRKAMELSGGQQKLVALGRALMCGHKLLLLDEPFEGVAPALAQRLVEVVGELIKEGLSVILSESNLQHSTAMLDRVFQIDRGVVVQGE